MHVKLVLCIALVPALLFFLFISYLLINLFIYLSIQPDVTVHFVQSVQSVSIGFSRRMHFGSGYEQELPVSHCVPLKPGAQLHLNPFTRSVQVPLFLQG